VASEREGTKVTDTAATGSGGAPDAPSTTGRPRTITTILASLVANLQGLFRTELELLKLELLAKVREKAVALGLLATAGLLGVFVLAFTGVTAAHLLALVLPAWGAWMIVTGVFLLVAVVCVFVAVRLLKRSLTPEIAKQEAVTTWAWARKQVGR